MGKRGTQHLRRNRPGRAGAAQAPLGDRGAGRPADLACAVLLVDLVQHDDCFGVEIADESLLAVGVVGMLVEALEAVGDGSWPCCVSCGSMLTLDHRADLP